jgi:hypothetical protein
MKTIATARGRKFIRDVVQETLEADILRGLS